ncbi:DUF2784 domain-containing protein [Coralloluteibacterium thermophilus]|uniref:DUF2784 domain-containing protein n=1 Tax=Coralloluteibacterium thermophilum TaxID=2707049 RepID=A0ABV9NL83_9GAMM
MDALSPAQAAVLADVVLAVHAAVVLFAVGGLLAIVLGGLLGWRWVRRPSFRIAHIGLVVFVALQAWLDRLCPLTVWEQALRGHAGQPVHEVGFIEHWLGALIFFEAPPWVFVLAYTAFAAAVALAWWWLPPRRALRQPR